MADRRNPPVDADALADTIVGQCIADDEEALGNLLREMLRRRPEMARQALQHPDVQFALAVHVSTTDEGRHASTAALLNTLRHVDPVCAADILSDCDAGALARSLSYVTDYTAQQVILLARLYACSPTVGRAVLGRCGTLLKDFLAESSFPYIDLPAELVADVERWRKRGSER